MSAFNPQEYSLVAVEEGHKEGILNDPIKPAKAASLAMNVSLVINVTLLIIKVIAFIFSSSKAVLASLVDSLVDILSQLILVVAENFIVRHSPDYPVGRSRLEALSVLVCAFIMSMAAVEGKSQYCIDDYLMQSFFLIISKKIKKITLV